MKSPSYYISLVLVAFSWCTCTVHAEAGLTANGAQRGPVRLDNDGKIIGRPQVAFRLDDVQDYWLTENMMQIFDVFADRNTRLTTGIIGGSFGEDNKIVMRLKELHDAGIIEFANHAFDAQVEFDTAPYAEQINSINTTNHIIRNVLGVEYVHTFIPHENRWSANTLQALIELEMSVLTTSRDWEDCGDTCLSKYNTLGVVQAPQGTQTNRQVLINGSLIYKQWLGADAHVVLQQIDEQVADHSFVTVMMHPQEYSLSPAGGVNMTQIHQLEIILDTLLERAQKDSSAAEIVWLQDVGRQGSRPEPMTTKVDPPQIAIMIQGLQDYYLRVAAQTLLRRLHANKIKVTAAVYTSDFGDNAQLMYEVQDMQKDGYLEIEVAGLTANRPSVSDTYEQQLEDLQLAHTRLQNLMGRSPELYVPIDNSWSNVTEAVLHTLNMTLGASRTSDPCGYLCWTTVPKHVPWGASAAGNGTFEAANTDEIMNRIENQLKRYGWAILQITPEDVAKNVHGQPNDDAIDGIVAAILTFQQRGIDLRFVSELGIAQEEPDDDEPIPSSKHDSSMRAVVIGLTTAAAIALSVAVFASVAQFVRRVRRKNKSFI